MWLHRRTVDAVTTTTAVVFEYHEIRKHLE